MGKNRARFRMKVGSEGEREKKSKKESRVEGRTAGLKKSKQPTPGIP